MARKPTRFWHPARRLLIQAQERARAIVTKPHAAASLDDVRPRLQHYLKAMYGESVTIESLAPPKKTHWTVRALYQLSLMRQRGTSESTPECIRLPALLPRQHDDIAPLEQYRVIAVQHAERIRRESAKHSRDVTTDLERDLYQLAEAATIDAQIIANQPGLRKTLDAARAASIAQRPRPRWRTDIELRVEEMFRRAWPAANANANNDTIGDASNNASDNTQHEAGFQTDLPNIPLNNDAEANATWARRTANALEAKYGRKAAKAYRKVPEITLWHTTVSTQLPDEQQFALESETRESNSKSEPAIKNQNAPSRSAMPGGAQSESSPNKRGGNPGQSASDNATAQTEGEGNKDRGDEGEQDSERTPETDAQSAATEQGTGATTTQGPDGQGTQVGVGHSNQTVEDTALTGGITFQYPEWDFNAQSLLKNVTTVRVMPPAHGSSDWAAAALRAHGRELHSAKRQFERLRSHRERLRRQVQGDELDLEACVDAIVDRRMGVAPTDRLYSLVRPGRRELAITLLIDVSGSTRDVVSGDQRVIDIERIAALVATAAFDALGDDYSILAFSSASATNVRVHTLKDFGERNSLRVLERISALEPHGTTRLGAAVRHATATLSNHPAPHQLLLILSDGKPHDYDWYFPLYAVQDSRHAIMNARLQGVHPFCITVDTSDEETYLAEIFGTAGYRVVSRPSQLAQAMLQAVQRMIGTKG